MDRNRRIRRGRARRVSGSRLLALGLLMAGCGPGKSTGPVEVVWDRDSCERCSMAISDQRFAAQIRSGASVGVAKFDDLGCASLWLDEHRHEAGDRPEVWVRDLRGERWLDATAARYVPDVLTPMNYGFGASAEPVEGALDWSEVRERIRGSDGARRNPGR